MKVFFQNRFFFLYAYAGISLLLYASLRFWLVLNGFEQDPGLDFLDYIGIGLIGLTYDVAFVFYVGLAVVAVFALLPRNIFSHIWAQWSALLVYFSLLFSLMFTLVAEVIYWNEFTTRFNFIAVDYLVYRHEVTDNINESYPVLGLVLGLIALSLVVFMVTVKPVLAGLQSTASGALRAKHLFGWLALTVVVLIIIGQAPRNSFENNHAKELASNGPYQFFAAFRNNELDYEQLYANEPQAQMSSAVRDIVEEPNSTFLDNQLFSINRYIDNPGSAKRLNVVLISEESLSASSITRYGEDLPLTPFIDKWIQESLVFDKTYATGTRTTRGLEAITLSIPPTPGRSVVKRPDNANMYSLGRVFAEQDYDVAYVYGGRGFFDNMNTFFSGNGYRIVDQSSFEDAEIEFANAWGVDDASLFRKVIQQADADHAEQKPFFFHVMTVSNHQPFTYPEGKVDLPSGVGRNGGIMYADYALEQFIEAAKSKPWFENTVFVMIADHTANSAGRIGLPIDKYHIPFLIYSPKHIAAATVDKVVSQIDLAPTLLALLNMDYESGFFGENVLSPTYSERALIGNYQKLGLYQNGEVVVLSPQRRVERVSNPTTDPRIEDIDPTMSITAEQTIAYYQSANYILKNRLNRVDQTLEPKSSIAQGDSQ